MSRPVLFALALWSAAAAQAPGARQTPPQPPPPAPAPASASAQPAPSVPLEKLGAGAYRLAMLHVDTNTREITVPARINEVPTIEFVATMRNGAKGYESALTVECDAIAFNTALLLIGVDPARSKPSTRQFDPATPKGDPVEVSVSWTADGKVRRVPVEELLFDQRSKKSLPAAGGWVYTGSTFVESPMGRQFLAQMDGVLIGLMHGPAAIIENSRNTAVDGYGSIVINPNLGIPSGAQLTLSVKALPLAGTKH